MAETTGDSIPGTVEFTAKDEDLGRDEVVAEGAPSGRLLQRVGT